MSIILAAIAAFIVYKRSKKYPVDRLKKEIIVKYVVFLILVAIRILLPDTYIPSQDIDVQTIIFVFYGLFIVKEIINKRDSRVLMVIYQFVLWFLLGATIY